MRRLISLGLILIAIYFLISLNLLAGDGPIQPEVAKFEQVNATDIVNLQTGDFVYTLPLMNVPAPVGNYPLVLSYHGGIGTNQDATWVGLGWVLNPGAINRVINGYPDDYDGKMVQSAYHDEGTGIQTYLNIELGPFGYNSKWDSNIGSIGENFYFQISASKTSTTKKGNKYTLGLSARYGNGTGFSLGIDGSKDGLGQFTGTVGIGPNSQTSSNGELYYSPTGGFSVNLSAGKIPLPFIDLDIINIGFGNSSYSWLLNESALEYSYGYLHQDNYYVSTISQKKFERQEQGHYLYTSQDIYSINAQGIFGKFLPIYDVPFSLRDNYANGDDDPGYLTATWDINQISYDYTFNQTTPLRNTKDYITFKFLNETGNNFITWDEANGNTGWGTPYNAFWAPSSPTDIPKYSSRKIIPSYDDNGLIKKFTIIDSDGKFYVFSNSIRVDIDITKSIDKNDNNKYSYSQFLSPYTSSWLLTAVKGPDYIDRSPEGFGPEDWGFWVNFIYEDYGKISYRSPVNGFGPAPNNPNVKVVSLGLRDYKLLKSVQTATHAAIFTTSDALDRQGNQYFDELVLTPIVLILNYQGEDVVVGLMGGDWREYVNLIPSHEPFLYFKYRDQQPPHGTGTLDISRNQLKPGEEGMFYSETGDMTFFVIKTSVIDPENWYLEFPEREFYANKMLPLYPQTSYKRLDRIDLYSGMDSNVQFVSGEWEISPGAVSLRSVQLNSDYLLCPNTPNSSAPDSKKLTLAGVDFLGKNGTSGIPGYSFEYAYGDYGTPANPGDFNPNWHADDWDNWGSFRDSNNSLDRGSHKTPQHDQNRADKAAAWSMTKVTTPTGGAIEVEYESDDYYHVSNTKDLAKVPQENLNGMKGQTTNFITVNNVPAYAQVGHVAHITEQFVDPPSVNTTTYYERGITDISGNVITISGSPIQFKTDPIGAFYNYYMYIYPEVIYGGGLRVKSLTSSNGVDRYKTTYSYKDSYYGLSKGVTASLPPLYGSSKQSVEQDYLQTYLDHDLSYGRPSPGVIYSQVEVMDVDNSGDPVNGKTIYEFYTAKDFPYEVTDNSSTKTVSIKDRSSIYGAAKKIEYYEQTSTTSFRLIKEDIFNYSFSDEVVDSGNVVKEDYSIIPDLSKKPLGMIQEKYAVENKYDNIAWFERFVDKQYIGIYESSSKTIEHFYDPDGNITANTRNVTWDALSGQPIIAAAQTRTNETIITKGLPAYWKYQEMEDKNMLIQRTQETSYRTDIDISNISNLTSYGFDEQDILSGEILTWSDEWVIEGDSNPVWRKNDTYVYNKQVDESDQTYHFETFAPWSDNNVEKPFPTVTSTSPWKMISNITQYNPYSYPIEGVGEDGSYNSSLFGYDDALVIAIATNARTNELIYNNYESETAAVFYTGQHSKTISGTQLTLATTLGAPSIGGSYKVELWVKASSGTIMLEGQAANTAQSESGNTNWQLLSLSGVPQNQPIRVSGNGYVDDLRIYPESGSMSTFAYDPLTWQVTAITSTNNVTTYYEYDEFGRLRLVRDNDGNILTRHSYNYAN